MQKAPVNESISFENLLNTKGNEGNFQGMQNESIACVANIH